MKKSIVPEVALQRWLVQNRGIIGAMRTIILGM